MAKSAISLSLVPIHIFLPSRLTHLLTALRAPRIYSVNAMSVLELSCVKLPYIENICFPTLYFMLRLPPLDSETGWTGEL